jgi:hypothetical protein
VLQARARPSHQCRDRERAIKPEVAFGAAVKSVLGGRVMGSVAGHVVWRGFAAAGLSLVLLIGCASVGNERIADATPETVATQLAKGKSTQQQVRELYGDPVKTSFTDSGNEIWEYDFTRMQPKPTNFVPYVNLVASGAEGDKKSLVIFFDKTKIVRQYTISSSKVDISQGLFAR